MYIDDVINLYYIGNVNYFIKSAHINDCTLFTGIYIEMKDFEQIEDDILNIDV